MPSMTEFDRTVDSDFGRINSLKRDCIRQNVGVELLQQIECEDVEILGVRDFFEDEPLALKPSLLIEEELFERKLTPDLGIAVKKLNHSANFVWQDRVERYCG